MIDPVTDESRLVSFYDTISHIPPMRRVLRLVCAYYGVSHELARSKRCDAPLARARHLAMWLSRNVILRGNVPSMRDLGHFYKRDHTSICYGVRIIEELMSWDPGAKKSIDMIRNILLNKASSASPLPSERREVPGSCLHKPGISLAAYKNGSLRCSPTSSTFGENSHQPIDAGIS